MLSIIVPVYNVEQYLNRCVESLVQQSYHDLEILLIDDGSTDNSSTICDQWAKKDCRIRVIHQKNTGLSGARNTGLLHAKGDWITFVDSDDYVRPQCYEKILTVLLPSKCDIGMFGVSCETDKKNILYEDRFKENKIYAIDDILKFIVLPLKTASWNKIFRKRILENIIFPEKLIHGEDLVYFLRVLQKNITLISCDYIGYCYIKHSNSITSKPFNNHSNDEVICKDMACEIIDKKFPEFSKQASIWRFVARLNIVRKLIETRNEEFNHLKNDYIEWMVEYYSRNSYLLSRKHRLIFILIKFHLLYLIPILKRIH